MKQQTRVQCYRGPADGLLIGPSPVDGEYPLELYLTIYSEPDESCDVAVFLSEAVYRLAKVSGRLIYCYKPPKV